MSNIHLVVAGVEGLGEALGRTGRFRAVTPVRSVSELRGLKDLRREEVVFLFADNLHSDLPEMPLSRMISRLVASQWRVIILAQTAAARDLVNANPAVGLLDGSTYTVNMVLAAVSGLPGVGVVPPLSDEQGGIVVRPGADYSPIGATVGNAADPGAASPAWGEVRPAWQPVSQQTTNDAPVTTPVATDAWGPARTSNPVETSPVSVAPAPDAWGSSPSTNGVPSATTGPRPPATGPRPPIVRAPQPTQTGNDWRPQARHGSRSHVETQRPARRGYTIAVTSPKGGTGKSTLSLNLAVTLGLRLRSYGKTVCIVDLNIQQGDTAKYLGLSGPTISKLAKDQTLVSRDRIRNALEEVGQYNLYALLAPHDTVEANPDFLNPALYRRVLAVLRELFDYIILDCPVAERFHDLVSEFAIPESDYILVPAIPSPQTCMNINRWLNEFVRAPGAVGGLAIPNDRIGVVLNRAEDDIDFDIDAVEAELAGTAVIGAIPESKAWKRANVRYEVVAAQNIPDLNMAMSHVLFTATGSVEPGLAPEEGYTLQKENSLRSILRILKRGK